MLKYNNSMRPLFYLAALMMVCLPVRAAWSVPLEVVSEEKPAAAISQEKVFYSQQVNPQEWGEWFADKRSYIQQTTALFQKAARIARDQGEEMQKAASASGARRLIAMRKRANKDISRIIEELQELVPPAELEVYHDKIIQSCQLMQSVIDAYSDGGSRYAAYTLNSVTLAMDAVKSLRELYAQHGASQENMDELADMVINSFFKDMAYHMQADQVSADQ